MGIDEKVEMDWLQLCERISKESDPHRLSELLNQLIMRLDAHRQTLRSQDHKPVDSPTERDK